SSYLLIDYYYERNSASNASNNAFITNRIGDAGFIIGLLILWSYVGTLNFQDVFTQIRAPMSDADGAVDRAGQFIRADWDTSKAAPVLRVSAPHTGSELVLFPRKPNLGEDHAT